MDSGQSDEQSNSQTGVVLDLVAMLAANRDEIATAQARAIRRQMHDSRYGQYSLEEISHNNLVGVDLLRDYLLGLDPFPSGLTRGIPEPTPTLARARIPLHEVVEAAWLLEDVIRGFLPPSFIPGSPVFLEAAGELAGGVRKLILAGVRYYAAELSRQIEEEHRQTVLMLEMTRQAGSTLELTDILGHAARAMARAAGTDHCVIFLPEESGLLCSIGAMTGNLPRPPANHLPSSASHAIPFSGIPVVNRLAEEQKPFSLRGTEADEFTAQVEGERWGAWALLAVPIVLKGRLLAAAVLTDFDKDRTFTPQQIDLTSGLAAAVAPAIENARLYQQVRRMAMLEERALLAQEIHDDFAQTVSGMQFRASYVADLLETGRVDEAQERVAELGQALRNIGLGVRESIFSLRAVSSVESGFLSTLQEYVGAYSRNYALDVQLTADEDAAAAVVGVVAVHAVRIVQEALSNARRHARASHVWVRLEREGPGICVSIEDDGDGFDTSSPQGPELKHYGLRIMHERAERISGCLVVESQPGAGTRVVLHLP